MTRCQNDMDCNASARDVLVPLLRNATLPVLTSTQGTGQTQVRLDLSSVLLSLENDAFQSREGWLAFAHLLRSISSCGCEVGFGYWGGSRYLEPTRVRIESDSVSVSVRLYPNTQLDVWFNGNIFSYSPDGASSPDDAANNFLNWFTTTANSEPFYLVVDHVDTTVAVGHGHDEAVRGLRCGQRKSAPREPQLDTQLRCYVGRCICCATR